MLTGLVLLPRAQAVVPAPDGFYPGFNTAEGQNALFSLDVNNGFANTAVGWSALRSNVEGDFNTATGAGSLVFNTGGNNTAFGAAALLFNTTGFNNTAVGAAALLNNMNGTRNNAFGFEALNSHTTGSFNNAFGGFALFFDQNGESNNAFGDDALTSNVSGVNNTAVGDEALVSSTGSNNTALGAGAGGSVTTANNVIVIGTEGANMDNSCFIGNIYPNVQPIVGTDPDSVTINSSGRLGRGNVSSRRYKHHIKPMDKASEALYALKPVSFRYNKEYDATQTIAFGLIAEDVAEVNADLVGRNPQGEAESVRYEQINAMLLNEFLKEHRKNEQQEATIARQQKQIEQLTAGLQKMSDQLELSKPASHLVLNDP
jgi:hypothetical protein